MDPRQFLTAPYAALAGVPNSTLRPPGPVAARVPIWPLARRSLTRRTRPARTPSCGGAQQLLGPPREIPVCGRGPKSVLQPTPRPSPAPLGGAPTVGLEALRGGSNLGAGSGGRTVGPYGAPHASGGTARQLVRCRSTNPLGVKRDTRGIKPPEPGDEPVRNCPRWGRQLPQAARVARLDEVVSASPGQTAGAASARYLPWR